MGKISGKVGRNVCKNPKTLANTRFFVIFCWPLLFLKMAICPLFLANLHFYFFSIFQHFSISSKKCPFAHFLPTFSDKSVHEFLRIFVCPRLSKGIVRTLRRVFRSRPFHELRSAYIRISSVSPKVVKRNLF